MATFIELAADQVNEKPESEANGKNVLNVGLVKQTAMFRSLYGADSSKVLRGVLLDAFFGKLGAEAVQAFASKIKDQKAKAEYLTFVRQLAESK